jgi:hypothetical protein
MVSALTDRAAVLLGNGRVLVLGGATFEPMTAAELFDFGAAP